MYSSRSKRVAHDCSAKPSAARLGGHGPQRPAPVVLHREQHLKQRRAGDVPWRVEPLDQPLERKFLVVVGVGRRRPDPVEQRGEGRAAGQVGAHRQQVDEASDQRLKFRQRAARDRGADGEVALPGVAPEQHLESGQQHHVRGRVALPGEVEHRPRQGRVEAEAVRRPVVGLLGRARPVGHQIERRQRGQPPLPVGEIAVGGVGQPVPLPDRVVAVLDGQLGQPRRPPAAPGFVEREQVRQQDVDRPAVTGDVVHRQREHVIVVGQPHQRRPGDRAGREVEGLRDHRVDVVLGRVGGPGRQDAQRQPRSVCVAHPDLGAPVLPGRIAHPQRLMPVGHVAERKPERALVERSAQPQRHRDRVRCRARDQLFHEPEALLREGQRRRDPGRPRPDRRHRSPAAQPLREQGLLGGGELPGRRDVRHANNRNEISDYGLVRSLA